MKPLPPGARPAQADPARPNTSCRGRQRDRAGVECPRRFHPDRGTSGAGPLGDKQNTPAILPVLRNDNIFVVSEALKALAILKDPSAAEAVAGFLAIDQHSGQAVQTLVRCVVRPSRPYSNISITAMRRRGSGRWRSWRQSGPRRACPLCRSCSGGRPTTAPRRGSHATYSTRRGRIVEQHR